MPRAAAIGGSQHVGCPHKVVPVVEDGNVVRQALGGIRCQVIDRFRPKRRKNVVERLFHAAPFEPAGGRDVFRKTARKIVHRQHFMPRQQGVQPREPMNRRR